MHGVPSAAADHGAHRGGAASTQPRRSAPGSCPASPPDPQAGRVPRGGRRSLARAGGGFRRDRQPDLAGVRDARGLAGAQVIQAGILPNPQLSPSLDLPLGNSVPGVRTAYGLNLNWEVTALFARGGQARSRARARGQRGSLRRLAGMAGGGGRQAGRVPARFAASAGGAGARDRSGLAAKRRPVAPGRRAPRQDRGRPRPRAKPPPSRPPPTG